jgi:capsular polysaccharide biosynthesis protein
MDTQIQIAKSRPILAAAASGATPPTSAQHLAKRISIKSPTEDILTVKAKAKTAAQAELLANSVAQGYVDYSNQQAAQTNSDTAKSVASQVNTLQTQITHLQNEANTTLSRLQNENRNSTQGQADTNLLASLRQEQGTASLQLNSLKQQAAASGTSDTNAVPGTRVFESATSAAGESVPQQVFTHGVLGLAAALLLAAVMTLILARRGRRPRLRDEVAEAVGAPVLTAISSHRPKPAQNLEAFVRSLQPEVDDAWSIRRALEALGAFDAARFGRLSLSFLTLRDDHEALGAAPQISAFLAHQGVRLSVDSNIDEDWMVQVRSALGRDDSAEALEIGERPSLFESAPSRQHARVQISAMDRELPVFPKLRDRPLTLLVLSPGAATTTELARLALSAIDADQRIDGVIMTNPDPGDWTIGRLPLTEVSERAVTPNRMTGSASRQLDSR